MANIPDGVYCARPLTAGVYEKNNALVLETRFTLCDEQGNAYTQTGSNGNEYPIERSKRHYLISKTGAVNTKVVEMLQKWAKGWDGIDPFWFADPANLASIGMVKVTLETDTYTASDGMQKAYQGISFINALDDVRSSNRAIESGDKAAIMAKYGAKFKAAFGGKPKTVQAAATPAAPAAKPAAPMRPAAAPARPAPAPTAPAKSAAPAYADGIDGANAAWDAVNAAHPEMAQKDIEDKWFATIDGICPGKDQADITGAEWAQIVEHFGEGAENPLATDPDDAPS